MAYAMEKIADAKENAVFCAARAVSELEKPKFSLKELVGKYGEKLATKEAELKDKLPTPQEEIPAPVVSLPEISHTSASPSVQAIVREMFDQLGVTPGGRTDEIDPIQTIAEKLLAAYAAANYALEKLSDIERADLRARMGDGNMFRLAHTLQKLSSTRANQTI